MDIIKLIYDAGIVGCGGAGFPAHIKLNTKVKYFFVNGAECEPLLRTDRYLMIHNADELIQGIELVGKHLEAEEIYIALKDTYHEEISSLEAAISKNASKIRIFEMDNYYPAGDEQMIICDALGKPVPPGGIPLDVDAVVSNVETIIGVHRAMKRINFTHKYVTINGQVKKPIIAHVPIGTRFEDCLKLAGGPSVKDYKIIDGGPLMGDVLDYDAYEKGVITKTTSSLIVISEDSYLSHHEDISLKHMLNRAKSACIQCQYCTLMCPRYLAGHPLEPHKIMRKLAYSDSFEEMLDDDVIKQALICCECGICELYACPMQLQPCRVNKILKEKYAKQNIRYERDDKVYEKREEREYTKIPSKRMASRAGVIDYYDTDVNELVEYNADEVFIPLQQHVGSPAKAVVSIGDKVKCGQLIGLCDQKILGANIHASIDGTIIEIEDKIIIRK